MAVLDFPEVNPDTGTSLSLLSNTTSFTSDLNNATQTGKLVGDQWSVNMPFTNRSEREGRRIKAFLARLGGMAGRFRMGPPDLNQLGTMQGDGVIDGAGQTGSTINTKGWLAGQDELFVEGDYLEVNGELKMVVDAPQLLGDYIEYSGTNLMSSPFDPEGWIFDSTGLIINNVITENPSGESFVGLVEVIGITGFSTLNKESEPYSRGEINYMAIICRNEVIVGSEPNAVRFRSAENAGDFLSGAAVDIATGVVLDKVGDTPFELKATALSDGFILLEGKIELFSDATLNSELTYCDGPNQSSSPPLGSKISVQGSFSGKSPLEYPYALYNEFVDVAELGEWVVQGCTSSIASGILSTSNTGGPSGNIRRVITIDTSKFTKIVIRWNRTIGTSGMTFRWFTSTTSSIYFFNESTQTEFITTTQEGSFYITEIDFSENSEWLTSANTTSIRFDVGEAIGDEFDIDYIKVYSPSLLQAYEDYWPASYLAKASINIAPPLRKATNDLNPIEVVNPQAIFMLADDSQAAWDLQANYIHGATIDCIEDVT